MTEVSEQYLNPRALWWLDSKGRCFVLVDNTITLLDGSGEAVKSVQADGIVTDICESASGKIIAVLNKNGSVGSGLVELNIEEEKAGVPVWLNTSVYGTGTGRKKDILITDEVGLYEYALSDNGKEYYIKWNETSYTPSGTVEDIKFISDRWKFIHKMG